MSPALTALQSLLVSPRRAPPASSGTIVVAAGIGLIGAVGLGLLSTGRGPLRRAGDSAMAGVRDLETGAAIVAGSVLADSALEHFRGIYQNRLMYVPPAAAAAGIVASLGRTIPQALRTGVFATSAAIGLSGLGLHIYNIVKRPGGLSWNNLFYAAPIAAPGALILSGGLGLAARILEERRSRRSAEQTRRELGRGLGFLLSGGILVTVAEVALLHFRGAYHNPAMYAPVTLPPLAAAALASAAVRPTRRRVWLSGLLLKATAVLGLIGSAFHTYGVQRNMGGWRNWTQNLFQGPPLPAPPSFTGVAIAGLGVLRLLDPRE